MPDRTIERCPMSTAVSSSPLSTALAPPARRSARKGRDPRLMVGIAVLLGSMVLGSLVLSRADRTQAVWAVARDVPAGATLSADDLRVVHVRLGAQTSMYVAAAGSPSGHVVRDLSLGELLPAAAVAATAVRPHRLVTVPVEQFHAPAGLARGELVDVYVTPRSDAGRDGPSTVVAERATVAEVEQDGGRFGSSARSVGVVLSLDPELVSRVVSGTRRGAIDLVRVPLGTK